MNNSKVIIEFASEDDAYKFYERLRAFKQYDLTDIELLRNSANRDVKMTLEKPLDAYLVATAEGIINLIREKIFVLDYAGNSKVKAMKLLRQMSLDEKWFPSIGLLGGYDIMGLADAKTIIENLPAYIDFVYLHGRLPKRGFGLTPNFQ